VSSTELSDDAASDADAAAASVSASPPPRAPSKRATRSPSPSASSPPRAAPAKRPRLLPEPVAVAASPASPRPFFLSRDAAAELCDAARLDEAARAAVLARVGAAGAPLRVLLTGLSAKEGAGEDEAMRARLTRAVTAGGGEVAELAQLAEDEAGPLAVVARRPVRTAKAMLALARGLPLLQAAWVERCAAAGRLLPPWRFDLPVPSSSGSKPPPRNLRESTHRLCLLPQPPAEGALAGRVFAVAASARHRRAEDDWARVVRAGGGVALCGDELRGRGRGARRVEYLLVAERQLDAEARAAAAAVRAPALSITWLCDWLVQRGAPPPTDASYRVKL
jgi:hypothetical protein